MNDVVDANLARFEHTGIAIITALALMGRSVWLVVLCLALVAAAAVFGERGSLFAWIYVRFVRAAVDPNPGHFEEEEPHRFSLFITALGLAGAWVALGIGAGGIGWTLTAVVLAASALAALTRWCAGCALYRAFRG